ncbi:hypothetical protein [Streptomyces sp. SA15]|uniref:hypothetical protein n=1 Tax=Streptomyces sp. SA15 TaxID=934019 RepID=UPI0015CA386B|nr:hypothetical protein [Streptomyces sp. SA15]
MNSASVSPERATVVSQAASVVLMPITYDRTVSIAPDGSGNPAAVNRAARRSEKDMRSMSTTFTVSAIGVPAAAVLATLVMRDGKPSEAEAGEAPGADSDSDSAKEAELVA